MFHTECNPYYLFTLVPLPGQHKWSEAEDEQEKNGHRRHDGRALQSRRIKNVSFRESITEDDIPDIHLTAMGGHTNGEVGQKAPIEENEDLKSSREVQEGSPVAEV